MGRKVAVITGGARRVGRRVGWYLAERGWDLVVTYRSSRGEAEGLAGECAKIGARCVLVEADLMRDDAVERIGAACDAVGRVDLLMHNASVFPKGRLGETTAEMVREVMRVHVEAPLLLTARLAPMLRTNRGCVIAMTDIAADRPYLGNLAYSASKAALSNLVLGLARTLAPEVRVNAIAPGAVEWPEEMPEAEREAYVSRVPMRRVGSAEDVAKAVWFLVEGAGYVTGQTIRVDGGRGLV
jgi:pteridine reductase